MQRNLSAISCFDASQLRSQCVIDPDRAFVLQRGNCRHVADHFENTGGLRSWLSDLRLDLCHDFIAASGAAHHVMLRRDDAVRGSLDVVGYDDLLAMHPRLVQRPELSQVGLRLTKTPVFVEACAVELRQRYAPGVEGVHGNQRLLQSGALGLPEGGERSSDAASNVVGVLVRIPCLQSFAGKWLRLLLHICQRPQLAMSERFEIFPMWKRGLQQSPVVQEQLRTFFVISHQPAHQVVFHHLLHLRLAQGLLGSLAMGLIGFGKHVAFLIKDQPLHRRHHESSIMKVKASLFRMPGLQHGLDQAREPLGQDGRISPAATVIRCWQRRLETADHYRVPLREIPVGKMTQRTSIKAALTVQGQSPLHRHQRVFDVLKMLLVDLPAATQRLPQGTLELLLRRSGVHSGS
mmetsp:Transcript_116196/g.276160  ORF Transcript_116196/g.276160 Transcript_116196/m.276160 type:complete len:406 (+) Transcript_116196:466-1683(+)